MVSHQVILHFLSASAYLCLLVLGARLVVRPWRPETVLLCQVVAAYLVSGALTEALQTWPAMETACQGSQFIQLLLALMLLIVTVLRRDALRVNARGETEAQSEAGSLTDHLQQAQSLFKTLVDNLPQSVFVKDGATARYLFCNKAALEFSGLGWSEVIGKTDKQLFPRDQAQGFMAFDRMVIDGGQPVDIPEEAVQTRTRGLRYLRVRKLPLLNAVGTPVQVLGIAEDVTELRQVAAEFRQTKVFLEHIIDNIPSTVFVKDAKTSQYVLMNKVGLEWLGFRREEVIGKLDIDLFPPAQASAFTADDRRVLSTKGLLEVTEERVQSRTLGLRYTRTRKLPLYDESGQPAFVLGIADDMSEMRRAQADLQRTKAFLESIVENIPHIIFVKNAADSRFVSVNRAAEVLFGVEREQIIGKSDYDFFSADLADRYVEADRMAICSGKLVDIPEEPVHSAAHGLRFLHTKKIALADDDGSPIYLLGISEDITERKHYEELVYRQQSELAHAQRLITVGEIGATLAHEFNQPVAAISNYAEGALLRISLQGQSSVEIIDILERILDLAEHAGRVVRGMRDLARKHSEEEWVDFNDLVDDSIRLLHARVTRGRIRLTRNLAPSLPSTWGDRTQLQQLLINILLNAIEALEIADGVEQKVLSVRTNESDANTLKISVSDNGHGMTPTTSEQIFEPFFTTKNNGLGLGMSICRSIVEAHRGHIEVQSQQDAGTIVTVVIPAGAISLSAKQE